MHYSTKCRFTTPVCDVIVTGQPQKAAYHIIFIASCQNQRIGAIIAPSMNSSHMRPVNTRLTDLWDRRFNDYYFCA